MTSGWPDPRIPSGPLADAWRRTREGLPLISPLRKGQMDVLIVGTGLAGASAAATLAQQGYRVTVLSFHDSPRRAHSVAAQGGINAARSVAVDGDSVSRLFADTLKGGDFRAREAGCQRLAEISSGIIDQCVAQGVPFAREYGGSLATRSFGGALVSRTFYARGQTGQQLLYGAYQALMRQVELGRIDLLTRRDVLELITVDGVARGVVARHLLSGELEVHTARTVLLCTGGYSNVYFLSTNALKSNTSAIWRAHRKGALFANPCFTQIHPTCIPSGDVFQSKLTLMSESLRNDGRVWLPKNPGETRPPDAIPEGERDYFLERLYPTYGNMTPRDVASRRARELCNAGQGVGPGGRSVYLDLTDAIKAEGRDAIATRYGNLMTMYERISGDDPYSKPMRIYPAPHYTMGGLWVDYHLMSSVPGLFVLGEANYSEHGANRLGASALMQGLADGYFIAPSTVTAWLASRPTEDVPTDHPACREALESTRTRISQLLNSKGNTPVDSFHRELGSVMIDRCGISRHADGLQEGLQQVRSLELRFDTEVRVPGDASGPNAELEKALRVKDFFGLAQLMLRDALAREESCGAHFREEHQSEDGEARRDDVNFAHIAAWEHNTDGEPIRHSEPLQFTTLQPSTRSYK
ncbi:fumarate reductase/succinate dehydrogenase flavoprotein subunit [Synechococcus sp. HB1133]|uniref:fumarate reductase/succinate dehydrogenase flavoprotein subunit n=1 Tax=unclassified Synechococcus TaxID=2626047 RepID=UPI001409EB3E|nr:MULTISPECIES: fumarate reductase/succinate dehydrogenase flavoprotein subunit [unclassified Synechococcus]MCB4394419.1 fumarate reductase/succinate dehydrogenase flavoprotein subunit [Synechococcus sp. PH41509]MCB4423377.1 fumarate reductase/succinate dehydrogenase flavoprotein subunit [Synechococcus sp. HB1133]MCB4431512.1 fumarate reductase/succinate dehydrogenase flavoprotein subunit [Synechococcus sp. HBA1120]NHI82325.1 fumarate reductase/succinate dehydrogenase flavoprotein subunit [Syn